MTGPCNQIPVLKHQRHVALERGGGKSLHRNLNGGRQFFLYQEINFFFTPIPRSAPPKLLRPLIASQCIPIAGTGAVPLAQKATAALSSNCPCPTVGEAVPHSRATPPLPGSLRCPLASVSVRSTKQESREGQRMQQERERD